MAALRVCCWAGNSAGTMVEGRAGMMVGEKDAKRAAQLAAMTGLQLAVVSAAHWEKKSVAWLAAPQAGRKDASTVASTDGLTAEESVGMMADSRAIRSAAHWVVAMADALAALWDISSVDLTAASWVCQKAGTSAEHLAL